MIRAGYRSVLAALLLAVPWTAPAAIADMWVEPLDPQAVTQLTVIVDFGAYRHVAARVQRIETNEPLEHLAAFADALRRMPELRALNPGLGDRPLRPGTRIIRPPSRGAPGWLIGAWSSPGGDFVPLAHGDTVPELRYQTRLCAIRLDKLREFRAHPPTLDPSWFCEAHGLKFGGRARTDGDPTARVEQTIRIDRIADGAIQWHTVSTTRFDDAGDTLTLEAITTQRHQRHLALATLGFLGLLGLVLVIHRRLRAPH
jgi:hypothetical protein